MDGYALWVWASYGVTALALIGLLLVSLRTLRRRRRILAAMQALSGRRRDRPSAGPPAASEASQGESAS